MGLSDYAVRNLAVAAGSQAAANSIKTVVDSAESSISSNESAASFLMSASALTVRVTVGAGDGGEATETSIVTLPAGSILHDVIAVVIEAFDGDATTTLEVGIDGNADKYIDTVDLDVTSKDDYQAMTAGGSNDQGTTEFILAETEVIATWTNTADSTAGQVNVYVIYTPFQG